MKDIFTTMEILLMTNTKFSAREYADKNENQPSKNKSEHNKLAEACWNGIITSMLPELFAAPHHKPFIIWQVEECNHLLYMQLGEENIVQDAAFTIHPFVLTDNASQN